MCTDYWPVIHINLQAASIYYINVYYQLWSFCYSFFFFKLCWYIERERERDQRLKMLFRIPGISKTCKSIKISILKIDPKTILSLIYMGKRKWKYFLGGGREKEVWCKRIPLKITQKKKSIKYENKKKSNLLYDIFV